MELGIVDYKKTNRISETEAIRISELQEDHYLDFKSKRISPADIQKPAVAFSNADGGSFIVGIEDKKTGKIGLDRWIGVSSLEEFDPYLSVLDSIQYLKYDWWYYKISNRPYEFFLGIQVISGDKVVFTTKKECFRRHGASSQQIRDLMQIRGLGYAKGSESYEDVEQPECSINILDESSELKSYIRNLNLQQEEPLDFLLQENLINENWIPNTASVLLFHKNPCILIPQAAIRISCYATSGIDELRDDLIFNERYEGSIFYLIEYCFSIIMTKLNEMKVWTINGQEQLQFHEDAIFEVLVNCLVHRDYSLTDTIRVMIFNNRIIFKSPGRLPNGINFENLLQARSPRNPKIMRYISKANRPGSNKKYVQEMGEGLNTVSNRLQDAKLQDPQFNYEENIFVVTLTHGSREAPELVVPKFIKKFGSITNQQLRDLLGILSADASQILSGLKKKGLIDYDNNNKSWYLKETVSA
ncbi:ATP-binding protein [Acinetobacter radioresistens]|uniref:ATP-binding protein n=1 Tax=Acinetobacter TaxID=469 RepID=UPI0021CDCD0F|nr:ATP-binding protein [Acinetobacter radioresistens]MCU4501334.1 putative DNA binding domain-containing protein [Acinetobacter radioresistens]